MITKKEWFRWLFLSVSLLIVRLTSFLFEVYDVQALFPDPMENLFAGVSTDASQCPSSIDSRMRSRIPNGIDICVRIRSGSEKSAILLAKCLVSFLQV